MGNALFLSAPPGPEPLAGRGHGAQRWLVALAGSLQLLVVALHAVASYLLAAVPFGGDERDHKMRFYRRLLDALMSELPATLGAAVQRLLGLLELPADYLAVIVAHQAVLTFIPLALMLVLSTAPRIDPELPHCVLRWALAFAAVAVLAAPYVTGDFWLSMAWGRSLAQGLNPYYEVAADAALGLPHPHPMRATYGPLWLANVGLIAKLTGGGLWAAIPLKLQLLGAYALLLLLFARLMRARPRRDQVLGTVCLGWLPLGFTQLVGEGHNDAVMCAFVMVWLHLLARGRPYLAAAALACATLVKFAAGVLFLAHVMHTLPRDLHASRAWLRRCAGSAAVALALAVLFFAPFYRDVHMADSLALAQSYKFYLPRDLYFWFVKHVFAPPYAHIGARVVDYALLVVVAYFLVRHVARPGEDSFLGLVLSLMSALLFCFGGHVWPWYVMWLLPLALLKRDGGLAHWIVGLAIAAPFPILVWNGLGHLPDSQRLHTPSAAMYAFAFAWAALWPHYVRAVTPPDLLPVQGQVPVGARRRKSTA